MHVFYELQSFALLFIEIIHYGTADTNENVSASALRLNYVCKWGFKILYTQSISQN